jgi:hypothetical protein
MDMNTREAESTWKEHILSLVAVSLLGFIWESKNKWRRFWRGD